MVKDSAEVVEEFNEIVNMTADELEAFLKTEESRSTGWSKDDGSGESIGHESGRKIVDILKRNPDKDPSKYTDEDKDHMRRVVSYCKRHLAQEERLKQAKSPEELEKTKSTRSLKNWGHDPMKTLKGTPASKVKPQSKGKPRSTAKPASKGKPRSTTKPTSQGKPEGKPHSTTKPTSQGKPTSKGKPVSKGKPASEGKPASTAKPASKGRPAPTKADTKNGHEDTGDPVLEKDKAGSQEEVMPAKKSADAAATGEKREAEPDEPPQPAKGAEGEVIAKAEKPVSKKHKTQKPPSEGTRKPPSRGAKAQHA